MEWLSEGANSWQLTAATFVGLMSVPGLVVLYGGVMQKRWSVNSMMMAFSAFAIVLIGWVLWGFRFAFGRPLHLFGVNHGILANLWGHPADVLGHVGEQGQALLAQPPAGWQAMAPGVAHQGTRGGPFRG